MTDRTASILKNLEQHKTRFGDGAGDRKLDLLKALQTRRLSRSKDVLLLHETLCFIRAYPDSPQVLAQVEMMLADFARRSDLRRHHRALVNSGIAGTSIRISFYQATATWLAKRWGAYLTVDWEDFEQVERLENLLPLLALYCETPGLDECAFELQQWLHRLKAPQETDASFLLRRLEHTGLDSFAREILFEEIEVPLHLSPGLDTPARTREKYAKAKVVYQTNPLLRLRPSIPEEVRRPPESVRLLNPREGRPLVDLARGAMAARNRDLDAFAYADSGDVRLVQCEDGYQFAFMGAVPERRFLLESLYGYLVLKSGVPIGYGTYTGLFNSAEVAFTIFDTFRAGESARVYGWALAIATQVFGFDTFVIDPYQLGEDNEDAVRSGAWWFYQKLGYRPKAASHLRTMHRELERMRADPAHRSSPETLRRLATENVYLHLARPREDIIGELPLENVGLHITRFLAERFGADRHRAGKACSRDAARLLGLRRLPGLSAGERLAWERWSPLILILPGVAKWPKQDKRLLFETVRAKGGRRESDFTAMFDSHRRLRRAIRTLALREVDA
ncbi:MAG: hypothetical protein ABII12_10610 [Planctomycetota bacterium]